MKPMPMTDQGKVSRTGVFSALTEVRRLLKRTANRHGTVQAFAPNRSQQPLLCPSRSHRRAWLQSNQEEKTTHKPTNMVTKKPEALLTPNAQPKGHEHAGSSAQTGWERPFSLWHERQIVAGETWLGKGGIPRMLRDRKQPFIRHYWLCSHTSSLQPAITAQMNTHTYTQEHTLILQHLNGVMGKIGNNSWGVNYRLYRSTGAQSAE